MPSIQLVLLGKEKRKRRLAYGDQIVNKDKEKLHVKDNKDNENTREFILHGSCERGGEVRGG